MKNAVLAIVALAGAAVLVTSGVVVALADRGPERVREPVAQPNHGPSAGGVGDEVWDGSVSFRLLRLDCGTGDIGDEDSNLDPDGKYCIAGFAIVNRGASKLTLPRYSYTMADRSGKYGAWHRGMDELAADDPHSLFSTPVPPKGGGSASVLFELPTDFEPTVLYLHADESSEGAEVSLDECHWNHYQGNVTGGCGPRPEPARYRVPAFHLDVRG